MGTVTSQELIDSRQGTHGEFSENSASTWDMLRVLQGQTNWAVIDDGKRHAAYMILHKLARALAGNPNEEDHWRDIAGYATLVADRINNPAKVIDISNDVFSALAVAWNIPRHDAVTRFQFISSKVQEKNVDTALEKAIETGLNDDIPDFMKKWGPKPDGQWPVTSATPGNAFSDKEPTHD